MKPPIINILVVDDEPIVRNGLVNLLKKYNIKTLATAENGQEVMSILNNISPDVLLLDLEMPVLNGSKALNHIRNKFPDLKVIIVSSYHDEELIKDHLNRGARAFISKKEDEKILAAAIRSVYRTGFYKDNLPELFKNPSVKNHHYFKLIYTKKEQEIIALLCEGNTLKNIAKELQTSEKTTEGHLTEIYKKVKVKNKGEFLKYAIESGLQFLGSPNRYYLR